MVKCKHRVLGIVIVFIAALMFCFMPLMVSAADAGTVELKASGSEALLIMDFPQAAAEEIASMQISLNVSAASGANIEFIFDSALSAEIVEARYHSETGILNIYLAGTKALFSKNSPLTVGKVSLSGSNASAAVNVVENSIKFVRGSELISPSDVKYPQTVTISTGSSSSTPSSTPSSSSSAPSSSGTPSSSGSSSSSTGSTPAQSAPKPSVPDESPVDMSSLLSALSRAESYKRDNYTESSYNALAEAINAARAVLSDNNATQDDIDEALLALENSLAMLVLKNEAPPENDGNNGGSGDSSDYSGNGNNSNSTSSKDDSDSSDLSNSAESSENSQSEPNEKPGNDTVIWIIVITAALIAAVTIAVVLKRKNGK